MATKTMLPKVLEAAKGHAEVTNRRPAAQPIGLYLMELRARAAFGRRPGPVLRIVTEWQTDAETSWRAEIRQAHARPEGLAAVLG